MKRLTDGIKAYFAIIYFGTVCYILCMLLFISIFGKFYDQAPTGKLSLNVSIISWILFMIIQILLFYNLGKKDTVYFKYDFFSFFLTVAAVSILFTFLVLFIDSTNEDKTKVFKTLYASRDWMDQFFNNKQLAYIIAITLEALIYLFSYYVAHIFYLRKFPEFKKLYKDHNF